MTANGQLTAESGSEFKRVELLLHLHERELMTKANVVGIGIGYKEKAHQKTDALSLIVMVSEKIPRAMLKPEDIIPFEIEGVPVDVIEVGQISTRPTSSTDW